MPGFQGTLLLLLPFALQESTVSLVKYVRAAFAGVGKFRSLAIVGTAHSSCLKFN